MDRDGLRQDALGCSHWATVGAGWSGVRPCTRTSFGLRQVQDYRLMFVSPFSETASGRTDHGDLIRAQNPKRRDAPSALTFHEGGKRYASSSMSSRASLESTWLEHRDKVSSAFRVEHRGSAVPQTAQS